MPLSNKNPLLAPPTDDELMAPPPPSVGGGVPNALLAPPSQEELMAPPPVAGTKPAPSSGSQAIAKELEERSFFNKPALGAEETTPAEIQALAKKHGVAPDELMKLAPYFGARLPGKSWDVESEAKRTAGFLGQAVGLGIPQKLYKKAQTPEMERALDDLQNLASGRSSWLQFGGEVAAPAVGVAGKAASLGTKVATGAATGAVAGASASRQGQELEGAAAGAVLGGAITGVAAKLARGAEKQGGKIAKVEQEIIEKQGPEIDAGTEAILKERTGSEKELSDYLAARKDLDTPAANKIVNEQLDPEHVRKLMDPETLEGRMIRDRVEKIRPDEVRDLGWERAIEKQLAEDVAEKRARDFAEELTDSRPKTLQEAREAISEYSSRQGAEATAERYRLHVENEAAEKYIQQAAVRGGRGDNFVDKALNFVSDSQFVLRDIDQKLGTSTERVHRFLNAAATRMSFARKEFQQDLKKIFQENKEVDTEIVNGSKIYSALDTGVTDGLSPQELNAVNGFQNYFQKGLDFVNNLVREIDPNISPLSIPKMANYVPHLLAETRVLRQKAQVKIREAKQMASQALGRQIRDLSQLSQNEFRQLESEPVFQDLIQGLQTLDAKPITTPSELSLRFKDTFESRSGHIALETKAKSAMERQGEIPMWMRETNLYKLADNWSQNTLKHLYLRKGMDELRSIAGRLEKAGADLEAKYIKDLLGDINGVRKGTAAEWMMQGEVKYQQVLDDLAEKFPGERASGIIAGARAIPEILGDINRQIYPNALGLSARAMTNNLLQTFVKTAPELGGAYGYTTVLRGVAKTAANWGKQKAALEAQGLAPAEFTKGFRRVVADGIRRSSPYAIPQQMLQGMSDMALYFYGKTDALNRSITLSTAEMMASDLAKGSGRAAQALKKFPNVVQKQVQAAGSEQEVAQILTSHLNASTQYNYNKISMSELGRVMGPFFATFSKWPLATAGEITQEFRDKGLLKGGLRNAEKYVVPWMLLKGADYALFSGDPEEMTERQKKFFGSKGLSGSAPLLSAGSVMRGDLFTPPAVDAAVNGLIIPALSGEDDKLEKGLAQALQSFAPGAGIARFLTDDLPTLITGDRPSGDNFIERTSSGISRLK